MRIFVRAVHRRALGAFRWITPFASGKLNAAVSPVMHVAVAQKRTWDISLGYAGAAGALDHGMFGLSTSTSAPCRACFVSN